MRVMNQIKIYTTLTVVMMTTVVSIIGMDQYPQPRLPQKYYDLKKQIQTTLNDTRQQAIQRELKQKYGSSLRDTSEDYIDLTQGNDDTIITNKKTTQKTKNKLTKEEQHKKFLESIETS